MPVLLLLTAPCLNGIPSFPVPFFCIVNKLMSVAYRFDSEYSYLEDACHLINDKYYKVPLC